MGYSVKWVRENLEITREMLRYYEKEGLIPIEKTRNHSNNYRDYSKEDLERVWGIKLLIEIGFSAKEIRSFVNDSEFDFYDAICKKVKELEDEQAKLSLTLDFAKTIKLTGCAPNRAPLGSIKFSDYMAYVKNNWNFYQDPQDKKMAEVVEEIAASSSEELEITILQKLVDWLGEYEPEQLEETMLTHGYYRVIVDMMPLGYDHNTVQSVVKCLHDCIKKNYSEDRREIDTPLDFAHRYIAFFIGSDLAKVNEQLFGREGCLFLANALAYFGGFELDKCFEEVWNVSIRNQ